MNPLTDFVARLRALLLRNRTEREMDEELADHVERAVDARIRAGEPAGEARRRALAEMGGVERCKEAVRDARGVRPLEDLGADLRYALRSLRRSPFFTLTVVGVLGLGLGGATAVFAVANRLLFADLPYPQADRVMRIFQQNSPTNRFGLSTVEVQAIAAEQRSFSAFGAVLRGEATLAGPSGPVREQVGRVTPGFFQVLGLDAAAGRLFVPADTAAGAAPAVVLGFGLARRTWTDPARAVGQSLQIDGVSHTVVGILPPGMDAPAGYGVQIWPVLRLSTPTRRGPFYMAGYGRLAPARSEASALDDLAGISTRIFPLWASSFQDSTARLRGVPLRTYLVGRSGPRLALFGGAVALVLLIAIANVATLLLVRASAREQEMAVRRALGATRVRLIRLVAAETGLLTLAAAVVACGLAAVGFRYATVVMPELARVEPARLDGATVLFGCLLAVTAAVLIGLSPISAAGDRRSANALRSDARRTGEDRRTTRLRAALVVGEFAFALPLLVGAGLLLNSLLRLERVDPGYDPRGAVSVNLALPQLGYPDQPAILHFWQALAERVGSGAGVTAAGLSNSLPPSDPFDFNNFDLLAHPVPQGSAQPVSPWSAATPGYFRALGIPVVEGRVFSPADSNGAPQVLVVSRSWARHYFPREDAVGQRLIAAGCTTCPPLTIVGVVGDVKYTGLAGSGEMVYEPVSQGAPPSLNLVVRSRLGSAATFRLIRDAVHALDPELPVVETTLTAELDRSLGDPRRWTTLLGAFAATAVLLAAVGVFGLLSYAVRQRRREIGVRLALGAGPGTVTRMIVMRGMRHALLGAAVGAGLTVLEVRWLPTLLYGVEPSDPFTISCVILVLLLAAFLASWLPARRAARVRPLEAIAAE